MSNPDPRCPHCDTPLSEIEIRSLWGHYTSSLRTTPPKAGPGRGHKKKAKTSPELMRALRTLTGKDKDK